MRCLFVSFLVLVFSPALTSAATTAEQVEAAAKSGKYTYVMFFRDNDAATQRMARTVGSHVGENSEKTTWVAINVHDQNEAVLVRRFDASRIPLPAVFGVAPNGAITGVFRQSVSPEQLANAILTPMYSEMVKGLQSQRIAIVCMLPTQNTPTPAGVTALQQDPVFQGKLHEVKAYATDSAEAEFFRRMKVDLKLQAPVVLIFAPPGTYLGTFDGTVSGQELAQKLHASGKCNCDHCQKK